MRELILNFHGLGEPPSGTDSSEVKYWLDETTFHTVLDDVCAMIGDINSEILFTFDDGNISDAQVALPALFSRGLKAQFFVCAGRIGKTNYLDKVAIAELLAAGMGIGSHGMDHVDWRRVGASILDVEISVARRKLEDTCGHAIDEIAIPFGSYDRSVITRLRAECLKHVYTSDGGFARCDSWLKPRYSLVRNRKFSSIIEDMQRRDTPFTRMKRHLAILYKTMR